MSATSPSQVLGLAADPLRWRLLRLLARERLNVGELTGVLGLAQSGVSRHLSLLVAAGLVAEEHRAGFTYAGLVVEPPAGLHRLWPALVAELVAAPDADGDDSRLAEALRARDERGEGLGVRPLEPGRSWAAWSLALGHLLAPARVVHLGADDGALSKEVARWASSVTAVTPPRAGGGGPGRRAADDRVRWVTADLERTGLPEAAFDLALVSQALALTSQPEALLGEAFRLVAPGGRLLVMDVLPHRQEWVTERLGHVRRGVAPTLLARWVAASGFARVRTDVAKRRRGNPFVVVVASGERPLPSLPSLPSPSGPSGPRRRRGPASTKESR